MYSHGLDDSKAETKLTDIHSFPKHIPEWRANENTEGKETPTPFSTAQGNVSRLAGHPLPAEQTGRGTDSCDPPQTS